MKVVLPTPLPGEEDEGGHGYKLRRQELDRHHMHLSAVIGIA